MKLPTKRKTYPWIVVNTNKGGRFECIRCGDYYAMNLPCLVDAYIAVSKVFMRAHRRCKERSPAAEVAP
jgi:hypothetical protein